MSAYVISFRIDDDFASNIRRKSLIEAIRREAEMGRTWEETTSLVVLKSDKSPRTLANSITTGSSFDLTKDKLLVVNTATGVAASSGKIDDLGRLRALFPQTGLLGDLLS